MIVEAIKSGSLPGLTLIIGPPGTGKTDVAVQIISNIYRKNPNSHILLITKSNQALNHLFEKLVHSDIDSKHLLRLGHGGDDLNDTEEWSNTGRINSFIQEQIRLLGIVAKLVESFELVTDHASTCEQSLYFQNTVIVPKILEYSKLKSNISSIDELKQVYPFYKFLNLYTGKRFEFNENTDLDQALDYCDQGITFINDLFKKVDATRPFELLRSNKDRANYLLVKEARVIAMTCTYASLKRREFVKIGLKYDSLIVEEAGQMLEIETFIPLMLQNHDTDLNQTHLKRVVLIGDDKQLAPIVQNKNLAYFGNFQQSLFARLLMLNVPSIQLDQQFRQRAEICNLYRSFYVDLKDYPGFNRKNPLYNSGLLHNIQLINVPDYQSKGETFPRKHFIQNLGEAEYSVQLFMYMRLIGYPLNKICILTTYNGQKELLIDILNKRCKWNPTFGMPIVDTVDRFQGREKDYVILSLVRTKSVGHLKDVTRLVVAMSRARLGLYVFCRSQLFLSDPILEPTFNLLLKNGNQLKLVKNEQYPNISDRKHQPFIVKDVVQMGAFVDEIAKTSIASKE
jgi:intron-binding protein aquarius